MYSAENEEVEFKENIFPTGNVEDWMLEIERVMKETLRQIIRDSLADYKTVNRINTKITNHSFKSFNS
jgi:dynein heavy chain